tara:strand:+ start:1267 stop:1629 length:363 start_codon:yes stop_codon:yes gene_type:complete
MATLTSTLQLVSSDVSSDPLSINQTKALTVTNPSVDIARQSVATTGQFNILTTANSSITYVYLKNADVTNIITIKDDAGNSHMDLGPGEMAFFPVKGGVGLEATANSAPCVLEYGFWTKS